MILNSIEIFGDRPKSFWGRLGDFLSGALNYSFGGGMAFSTKHPVPGNQSTAIVSRWISPNHDGNLYTNIDNMSFGAPIGVNISGIPTVMEAVTNIFMFGSEMLNVYESASEFATTIMDTPGNTPKPGDTTLYDWDPVRYKGTASGTIHRIRNHPDSIKKFNETHRTIPPK